MKLFTNVNNTVQVVMTEEDRVRDRAGEPLVTGVFLFVPEWAMSSRAEFDEPHHGTREEFAAWLQESNLPVVVEDLYVPFSNGKQLYAWPEGELDRQLARLAPLDMSWRELLMTAAGLTTVS